MRNIHKIGENIYITSDEEINEPCWCWDVLQKKNYWVNDTIPVYPKIGNYFKKIILTDNKDLIKNGVQSIDDEFLQWFAKNPNCEEVEVVKIKNCKGNYLECFHTQGQCDCGLSPCKQMFFTYKTIIPKERPKEVAKWQRERSYSEEEVKNIAEEARWKAIGDPVEFTNNFDEWFKQFKKK